MNKLTSEDSGPRYATSSTSVGGWPEGLSVDGMKKCSFNDTTWCPVDANCDRCNVNPYYRASKLQEYSDDDLIAELQRRLKK